MDQQTLERLLEGRRESRRLDFKEELDWIRGTREANVEVVRDVLGMANTREGGYLVFGVRDHDSEPIGLSEEAYDSFDQTRVNDLVHNYTDPRHSCHVHKYVIDRRRFVVLHIPEFTEIPIICAADANRQDTTLILRRGQIYIRTDAAATVAINSSEDMRELVERAVTRVGDRFVKNFLDLFDPGVKRQLGVIVTGSDAKQQTEEER